MEITAELKEKLSQLNEKYAALGEDFNEIGRASCRERV